MKHKTNYKGKRKNDSYSRKGKENKPIDSNLKTDDARTDNDVSWYSADSQLLRDTCSIPFSLPLGLPFTFGGQSNYVAPGVMAIHYVPAIGNTGSGVSSINMAAQSIYSYVNYANSRNKSYDRTDLMLFLLAMDSAISYYNHLRRIYGIAKLYSATNRYLPMTLLRAMGVAPSIINGLADFRAYINMYAWKLGSFFVPKDFTYLLRHSWMNSFVYSDSPSPKSQLLLYVQDAYYKYSETGAGGGSLVYLPYDAKRLKSAVELANYGDDLLRPLLDSQDIGMIGSDILKAFGEGGLVTYESMSEDYTITPIFNPEVNSQIENTTLVGALSVSQHLADITQSDNNLIQALKVSASGTYYGGTTANSELRDPKALLLNMHNLDVTPEQVMVATRNMSYYDKSGLVTCGSEVCTTATVYSMNEKGVASENDFCSSMLFNEAESFGSLQAIMMAIKELKPFGVSPYVVFTYANSNTGSTVGVPFVDFDVYTPLDVNDLSNMHTTALLSMFAVPKFGSFNGK